MRLLDEQGALVWIGKMKFVPALEEYVACQNLDEQVA